MLPAGTAPVSAKNTLMSVVDVAHDIGIRPSLSTWNKLMSVSQRGLKRSKVYMLLLDAESGKPRPHAAGTPLPRHCCCTGSVLLQCGSVHYGRSLMHCRLTPFTYVHPFK